jgi:Rap1a immunity proteins
MPSHTAAPRNSGGGGTMGTTAALIILVGLAVGLATGAKAEPDFSSANFLILGSKAFANQQSGGGVSGYCVGLVEGIAFFMADSGLANACAHIPDGVTVGQQIQVVVRYLEQRPNRLHEDFKWLAIEALADAWPCRDAKLVPKR